MTGRKALHGKTTVEGVAQLLHPIAHGWASMPTRALISTLVEPGLRAALPASNNDKRPFRLRDQPGLNLRQRIGLAARTKQDISYRKYHQQSRTSPDYAD
ncbi:hypothetical protein JFT67_05400 [Pseudomonas simiae]|nr:hypothetical protein [Pseudomonas simiae]MBJ2228475.1 hypothetical protein [Pseudomonas simiae]